jgi:hypothetical protein
MPSKTETAARRLVAKIHRATGGQLLRWCSLDAIGHRADAAAIQYAVQREWVQLSPGPDPHSIALAEAGRSSSNDPRRSHQRALCPRDQLRL